MYEFFVAFEHLSINTKMKLLSKRRRRSSMEEGEEEEEQSKSHGISITSLCSCDCVFFSEEIKPYIYNLIFPSYYNCSSLLLSP